MDSRAKINFKKMLRREGFQIVEKIDTGEYQLLDGDGELICKVMDEYPDFTEKLKIARNLEG